MRQIEFLADMFAEKGKSGGASDGDPMRIEVLRELTRRLKEPARG